MLNIFQEAKKIEDYIVNARQTLHQIPELDLDLPLTSGYVLKELEEMGIKTQRLSSCSGVVGLIEGREAGKVIALRADMDGLPIREETGLPFAAQNGNMHACGHDAHTAMLLGAAKILTACRTSFKGGVKLLFQPGEECSGGALPMIEEGVLENPHVDAVLAQHIGNLFPSLKNGQVGICKGIMMASQDHFYIKIIGKGSHGAYPADGIDPIVISATIVTALQTLISRELNGTDCAVLTIGKIEAGEAYNVIPGEAYIEGTLRTLDNEIRNRLERRIRDLISGISQAMGGDAEINYVRGYPLLSTDRDFTSFLARSAAGVIGEENIIELDKPSMGSEDMAFFLEKVPGSFYILSSMKGSNPYAHHNSRFDIDESVMLKGAAILAQTALDWLNANEY